MSEQPLDARIVDLESISESLRTTLMTQTGLLRLEPTVRSTLKRLKISSVSALHQSLRPDSGAPSVVTSDGLVLSLADGVLNAQIDIATDIAYPALGLAERLQAVTADVIQRSGLTLGAINITILSIEGSPDPAHPDPLDPPFRRSGR